MSQMGQNFPVSEYYQGRILDAHTISRSGGWWTAVLLIKDPKTEKPFLSIYRWQKRNDDWKTVKSFSWKKVKDISIFIEAAKQFSKRIDSE